MILGACLRVVRALGSIFRKTTKTKPEEKKENKREEEGEEKGSEGHAKEVQLDSRGHEELQRVVLY